MISKWYQNDIIKRTPYHIIRNNTYIYVLSQSINNIDLFYPDISGQYIHVMQSIFCSFGQNAKYIRIPCISMDRGLVYIKKVDLFCHNTQMSSTPTPHQKITPSTSSHLPLHHPTPKIPLFWFETDFVPTLHYTHQTLNKINTLPHVLYQFKNLKNIRTHQITNIKTQKPILI